MTEPKTAQGRFRFEDDTKRYHRFKIELDSGINGTVYIPKDISDGIPQKILLDYADKSDS